MMATARSSYCLLLIAMAVAAFLFILLRPVLETMSYGAIVSTVAKTLVAVYRTQGLEQWSARAVATILAVVGAVLVTLITWQASGILVCEGMSLAILSANGFLYDSFLSLLSG